MADTRQIVQWALGKRCLLRESLDAEVKPAEVIGKLWSARAYSKGLRSRDHGCGVFGDVYVGSTTSSLLPEEKPDSPKLGPSYPCGGFIISKEFEHLGGPDHLFRMCHACPANVWQHEIASCAGHIYQRPESPETESQLENIISRLGLRQEVEDCLPATCPRWFGLWAVSPIPAKSLPILRTLLSEMLTEDKRDMEIAGKVDHNQLHQFASLVAAIKRAESNGLALHVQMLPPGHTDFGVYTIFPHCPFCKASASVGRWQRRYPSELQTCEVCGTRFSPAETGSLERMNRDRLELRDVMGEAAFRKFAADYLVARGEHPERAVAIVEVTEADVTRSEEMNRQHAEMERLREQYLQQHVYSGLPCLASPPPEFLGDEDEQKSMVSSTGWFDAENMTEVLRRCERLGISVSFMQHYSADDEADRFETRGLKAPLEILAKWLAEGCKEKFYANCHVPDTLVRSANSDV